MPELPDNDPRIRDFTARLTRMIQMYVGKDLDNHTMRSINTMIDHQRINFKQTYGYDIPKLVAIVLPTSRFIHFFRADLETPQIHTVIGNMLRELGMHRVPVDKRELATAIKLAWPQYDPTIEVYDNDRSGKVLIN